MVYRALGRPVSQEELWAAVGRKEGASRWASPTYLLCQDALKRGLNGLVLRARPPGAALLEQCQRHGLFAILQHCLSSEQRRGHFSVLVSWTPDQVTVHDPQQGPDQPHTAAAFQALWARHHSGYIVLALAEPGQEDDLLLRSTEFVWSAADNFAPPAGDSLPLAFAPAPCLRRHIGLAALERVAQPWHFTFTSASNEGLRAATLAGLGVAVMTRTELVPGLKIVNDELGLPALPKAEYVLVRRPGEQGAAADEFTRLLQDHA